MIFLVFILGITYPTYGNLLHLTKCASVSSGPCSDNGVQFYHFTRSNWKEPQLIEYGNSAENVSLPYFNASHQSKFLMHGYNSDMTNFNGMKDAYLTKGEYNVFLLQWKDLCPMPCYLTAVYNALFVGKCSALLVKKVLKMGAKDIHLVGFSLGAHVAAYTANNLLPYKLPRITGLDPAMPFFITVPIENKLDPTDAKFVDVIHTNSFFQGKSESCGHVDFFMNGGIRQPGCRLEPDYFGCNHRRALVYFEESITSTKGFWAWKCGGILSYMLGLCPPHGVPVLLGEYVNTWSRGFHVAETNSKPPFALGKWK